MTLTPSRWCVTIAAGVILLMPQLGAAQDAAQEEPAFQKVLQAAGWDQKRLEDLAAKESFDPPTIGELLRLADSLGRFRKQIREEAQRQEELSATLVPMLLKVVVESVTPVDAGSASESFVCQTTAEDQEVAVYCRSAPQAWTEPGVLPQPAELVGLRLNESSVLALDWRWLPQQARYPQVNFGESVLGGLGVDVAGLDQLEDGRRLLPQESDVFYEVLAAMQRLGANQLVRFAKGNLPTYAEQWRAPRNGKPSRLAQEALKVIEEGHFPVAPLYNDAVNQRGELYVLEGTARRVVLVEAAAAADSQRGSVAAEWGVDRYYEIDLFTADAYNLPVVFCTLEAPAGLPLGDDINVPVRVAGFLLKRWAYDTRKKTAGGRDKPQLAPLLVGRAPILLPAPAGNRRVQQITIGGGFVLALVLIVWVVWRTSRSDAQYERLAKRRAAQSDARFDPQRLAELDATGEAEP